MNDFRPEEFDLVIDVVKTHFLLQPNEHSFAVFTGQRMLLLLATQRIRMSSAEVDQLEILSVDAVKVAASFVFVFSPSSMRERA